MARSLGDSSYAARKTVGSFLLATLIGIVVLCWILLTAQSIRRTALAPGSASAEFVWPSQTPSKQK